MRILVGRSERESGVARVLLPVAALVLAVVVALMLRYSVPLSATLLEKAELRTLDARFLLRGPRPLAQLQRVAGKVVIVAMDSAATGRLGHPIPRMAHARLVEQLHRAGARAIVFDVLFTDPSRPSSLPDTRLAAAIARTGNVYLPFDHDAAQPTPPAIERVLRARLAYPLQAPATARDIRLSPPVVPLFAAMRGGGHIGTRHDADGTFRRALLLMECGAVYPHTALDAVACEVWKINPREKPSQLLSGEDGEYLQLGTHRIGPLQRSAMQRGVYDAGDDESRRRSGTAWSLPLDFLGGHDVMQRLTVPYLDALEGRADERIKGRVVIIGETATGTPDLRRSPFDRQEEFLGVENNATFIANLLENDFLHPVPWRWTLLATFVLGLLGGGVAFLLRPWAALLAGTGVLATFGAVALLLFAGQNRVLEMTAPLLAATLSFLTLTMLRLNVADRQAREYSLALRETQTLLGQYVNERLAEQLSHDAQMRRDLQIGSRREVTVLFSDVRNFTAWSETQTPEEVKTRLDEYFSTMCEIIADEYDGYVDKFVGDGLMAVWNGMSDQDDHARRGVRAALSMQRAMGVLNDGWRRQKQAEFQIGIGIASGLAVFGTFGSPRHKLMPTVLGDTVNLAARLQNLTKDTGDVLLISENTFALLGDEFETRPLGTQPVRGKSSAQAVYEVSGAKQ